jgi:uncharacterized membrane-anchored protein
MTRDRILILAGLALVMAVFVGSVVQKEGLVRDGRSVFLKLAPVDPRSLIQGDYMVLAYALEREMRPDRMDGWPADGRVVVTVDPRGVATAMRHDGGAPLREEEVPLRYRIRDGRLRIGAESFFFQEGHRTVFEGARYGELRVADSGDLVLVNLRDDDLEILGPDRWGLAR